MARESLIPLGLIMLAAPAAPVPAAVYTTADAVQRRFFPEAQSFELVPLVLTDAQRGQVGALGGAQAGHGRLQCWRASAGGAVLGHVFVDEVIGRQDFITYAVGISASGRLRPVEIIEYRESHGGEIRNRRWLAQFDGRASVSNLRFGADIKNIAGATLSSEHVTSGVRRIFAIWQVALAAAPPTP